MFRLRDPGAPPPPPMPGLGLVLAGAVSMCDLQRHYGLVAAVSPFPSPDSRVHGGDVADQFEKEMIESATLHRNNP